MNSETGFSSKLRRLTALLHVCVMIRGELAIRRAEHRLRLGKRGLAQCVGVSEETESSPSHWGWKRSTSTSLEPASDEFISTSAGVVGRGGFDMFSS